MWESLRSLLSPCTSSVLSELWCCSLWEAGHLLRVIRVSLMHWNVCWVVKHVRTTTTGNVEWVVLQFLNQLEQEFRRANYLDDDPVAGLWGQWEARWIQKQFWTHTRISNEGCWVNKTWKASPLLANQYNGYCGNFPDFLASVLFSMAAIRRLIETPLAQWPVKVQWYDFGRLNKTTMILWF